MRRKLRGRQTLGLKTNAGASDSVENCPATARRWAGWSMPKLTDVLILLKTFVSRANVQCSSIVVRKIKFHPALSCVYS